ncbi:DUF2975 domain-containing protein [Paenimyroides baculatum]|uniref:DUF2975 domain-containing protein n=1 Tax=Paenimyroides baculatum TaxID=2608000 RepID=A0A5M6CGP5_9FLAO|nr:DUF2975 domain-containing protein [Paenimyroides baculatum]KAA5534351.1 hypothetical protein F0460_09595 [Paenimyroides baculatum]
MEIRITTSHILKVLLLLTWIIFIGLCVEAGAIIVNTFITLFINPDAVKNFWEGADILAIYQLNTNHFTVLALVMIIIAVLKAIMFYLILKLLSEKKLDFTKPFNTHLKDFILKLSYLSFGIGLFTHCGSEFCVWITGQGAKITSLESLNLTGSDVWFFMAIILLVITQIIKKGIEFQSENDLTI